MQPSAMTVISAGHLVFSSDLRLSVKQVSKMAGTEWHTDTSQL